MTDILMVAMLVAIPPTVLAAFSLWSSIQNSKQLRSIHIEVNDRLSQLLKKSEEAAHAKGRDYEREHGPGASSD